MVCNGNNGEGSRLALKGCGLVFRCLRFGHSGCLLLQMPVFSLSISICDLPCQIPIEPLYELLLAPLRLGQPLAGHESGPVFSVRGRVSVRYAYSPGDLVIEERYQNRYRCDLQEYVIFSISHFSPHAASPSKRKTPDASVR